MQDIDPNLCVNFVIEKNRTGFYSFIQQPVSGLSHHPTGVRSIWDVEDAVLENAILSQEEEGTMVERMESCIRPKLPEKDEQITLINQIIDRIIEEREITKVDHICQHFNINKRKLQRIISDITINRILSKISNPSLARRQMDMLAQ